MAQKTLNYNALIVHGIPSYALLKLAYDNSFCSAIFPN